MHMQNTEFILVLLLSNYCVVIHMSNCKLAPSCMTRVWLSTQPYVRNRAKPGPTPSGSFTQPPCLCRDCPGYLL